MSDPAFVSSVVTALTVMVNQKTLVELTNQRSGEVTEEVWSVAESYTIGDVVEHNSDVFVATDDTAPGEEPGVSGKWDILRLEVNDTLLEEVAKGCCAEVEEKLGRNLSEDALAVKYAAELVISDLANRFSVNMSDIGLESRARVEQRIEASRKARRARQPRIATGERKVHTRITPEGTSPFGGF